MKSFITAASLLIGSTCLAQGVEISSLNHVGVYEFSSTSVNRNLDLESQKGPDQVWDLSQLRPSANTNHYISMPANQSSLFPEVGGNSTHAIEHYQNGVKAFAKFFNHTESNRHEVALFADSVNGNWFHKQRYSGDGLLFDRFPLKYSNQQGIDSSLNYYEEKFSFRNQDTVSKTTISIKRHREIDAYGELRLPQGNFETLRVKDAYFYRVYQYGKAQDGTWSLFAWSEVDERPVFSWFTPNIPVPIFTWKKDQSTTEMYNGSPVASMPRPNINNIKIYPNPLPDPDLMVDLPEYNGMPVPYQFHDITGKVWLKGEFYEKANKLNTQGIPKGIYFLSLESGTTKSITKVIKQ